MPFEDSFKGTLVTLNHLIDKFFLLHSCVM